MNRVDFTVLASVLVMLTVLFVGLMNMGVLRLALLEFVMPRVW